MSTANPPLAAVWTGGEEARDTTGPEPRPYRPPVLIHDAVLPWRGETLLLALLRDSDRDRER